MPIYTYSCHKCWDKFEFTKDWNDPDPPCPSCDGNELFNSRVVVKGNFSAPLARLNWTQKDGEGFTSKYVREEELAEMNAETRNR